MPMALNLFHPLIMMKERLPETLNKVIRALFPQLPINTVDKILIMYIPVPITNYPTTNLQGRFYLQASKIVWKTEFV
jgi:hypothetical protein